MTTNELSDEVAVGEGPPPLVEEPSEPPAVVEKPIDPEERLQDIRVELDGIVTERANLRGKLGRVTAEGKRLTAALSQDRERIEANARSEAERYFSDSDGKFLDQILKLKLVSPEMRQTEQKVIELGGVEKLLEESLRELGKRERTLQREAAEIEVTQAARKLMSRFDLLFDGVRRLQDDYEPFLSEMDAVKAISEKLGGMNWTQRLVNAGCKEWQLILLDSVLADHRTSDIITWLFYVARSSCGGKNPFYRGETLTRKFQQQNVFRDIKTEFVSREQPTYNSGR